jgi:uncharacterized protein
MYHTWLWQLDLFNEKGELQKKYKIEEIKDADIETISKELNCPILLLKDIITELLKPGYDVRNEFNEVEFSKDIKSIEDLKEGFIVSGVVRNITDFGAFVDIGLKNDGLIHISQISEKRISHPMDVLSINQQLKNIKVINDVIRVFVFFKNILVYKMFFFPC